MGAPGRSVTPPVPARPTPTSPKSAAFSAGIEVHWRTNLLECNEKRGGEGTALARPSARARALLHLLQGGDFQHEPSALKRFVMLGLVEERPDGHMLTDLGQRSDAEQRPR